MAIDEKKLIEVLKQRIAAHEKDAAEIGSYAIGCNGEELLLRLADEVQAIIEVVEAQPKVNEWISCSEMLPEEEYDTVLAVTDKNHYAVYVYTTKHGFRTADIDAVGEVVAWMSLPEPYKPE